MNLRKIAFKNKDTTELKCVEKDLRGKLWEAKRAHKLNWANAFKNNNTKQLWDTTGLSKSVSSREEAEFANQLNSFFSRFDDGSLDHVAIANILNSVVPAQSELTFLLRGWGALLKSWIRGRKGKLAPTWKTSHVVPLPQKACPKESGDYRPVALTPVLMKTLERILVQHLTE